MSFPNTNKSIFLSGNCISLCQAIACTKACLVPLTMAHGQRSNRDAADWQWCFGFWNHIPAKALVFYQLKLTSAEETSQNTIALVPTLKPLAFFSNTMPMRFTGSSLPLSNSGTGTKTLSLCCDPPPKASSCQWIFSSLYLLILFRSSVASFLRLSMIQESLLLWIVDRHSDLYPNSAINTFPTNVLYNPKYVVPLVHLLLKSPIGPLIWIAYCI